MVFSVLVAFFLVASMSSNLFPFNTVFNWGNSQKSHGAMSEGLNDRNAMTCPKYLDGVCCVFLCSVVM